MLERSTVVSVLCLLATHLLAATPTEKIAFEAAVRAFEGRFFDRAERQFNAFVGKFADSDLTPKAQAFSLRARAHNLAQQKDHAAAAAAFRNLRLEFPNSPNHLEFIIGEAWSEFHLEHWETVISLLDENGPFRLAATIRPNDPIALPLFVSGKLLLAQTYLEMEAFVKAKAVLDTVTDWDLRTEFAWRRRFILTRLQLARSELEMALQNADALMDLANNTENQEWISESASLYGQLLVANNQPEAAIATYKKNLAPGTPPLRHREAWLKIIELEMEQRNAQDVINLLEEYIAGTENDESLDIALLTLGELNLQRYYEEIVKPERIEIENAPTPIDYLNDSRLHLEKLIEEYPESTLLPMAQYHRGWCYWELSQTPESVTAFKEAAEKLPKSFVAAVARFKLADGYYVLGQHKDALKNYRDIVERYENTSRIRETFLDQVLYQTVRASIADDDTDSALLAISKLIAIYPDSLLANTSRLLVGQHLIHINKVSEAREVFVEMIEHFNEFPLKAEVDYAIAYSWELQGEWARAAALYRNWIEDYPSHQNQAKAAYSYAWCRGQAGQEQEALVAFREFLEDHQGHPLAQRARLWLGNHYFNAVDFEAAERQYRVILRQEDAQQPELSRQALLMASRASFRQNKITQSAQYLRDLSEEIKDSENVSPDFRAQVELNLGDVLFEVGKQASPNQEDTIGEARLKYARVGALHPGSRLAAIAFGRYGDASYFLKRYPEAIEAYERVLNDFPEADISIRSQAEVGLAMSLERLAEENSERSDELLDQALQHYLNIVYLENLRANELPDPFWLEEAGLKAGTLVEARQDVDTGVRLYRRLAELLPPLREDWDRLRIALEARSKNQIN